MTDPAESRIGKRTANASARLLKSILAVLVFSASILVLTIPEDKDAGSISNPVQGQIAFQTIYSECEFLTEDFEQTRRARERAEASVPLYYKRMDDASDRIKHTEAIIYSMTKKERANPGIIDGSRRLRIAKGCGLSVQDVNALLKNFKQMHSVIKKLKGSKINLPALLGL